MNTITVPQLAPEACHDPQPTPELCLLAAVVQMALRDLQQSKHRDSAQAFIQSKDFAIFCEWLGWDVEQIRSTATPNAPVSTYLRRA